MKKVKKAAFDAALARRGLTFDQLAPFLDAVKRVTERILAEAGDDGEAHAVLTAIASDPELQTARQLAFGDAPVVQVPSVWTQTLDAIQHVMYGEDAARHLRGIHLRDFVLDRTLLRVARVVTADDLPAVLHFMMGLLAARIQERPQPMLWHLVQVLNYALQNPTFAEEQDEADELPTPTVM